MRRNLAQIRLGRICGDAEFQDLSDAGIRRLTRQCVSNRTICRRFLAILVFAEVDQPDFVAQVVAREVNDDVIAFSDTLLVELNERDRLKHQVAIVGNLDHRRGVTQRQLEEARNAGVQDAEAILAALHFKEWLVAQVHGHHVADKSI